ncbi:MAG: 50S ribosomal protein L35 [Mycoplasmataceae bacterium]|nr:50S ribosomal protein L35 [Mycoplasmataceae bacterium]
MAKVKRKTKSAATKRFKKMKNGNVKRGHAKTSHLFSNKTTKQKRHLSKQTMMDKSDSKRINKII